MDTFRFFETSSNELPFAEARDEMRAVYDLLEGLANAPRTLVNELIAERHRLETDSTPILIHGIDVRKDLFAEYNGWRVAHAEETVMALREGAGLLLVFAFLERGLRGVAEWLEDDESVIAKFLKKDAKKDSGRSKIDGYISFLEERGVVFPYPRGFDRLLTRERRIRNSFAHGDWDLHYVIAKSGDSLRALQVLTPLFERIERATSATLGREVSPLR